MVRLWRQAISASFIYICKQINYMKRVVKQVWQIFFWHPRSSTIYWTLAHHTIEHLTLTWPSDSNGFCINHECAGWFSVFIHLISVRWAVTWCVHLFCLKIYKYKSNLGMKLWSGNALWILSERHCNYN